MLNKENTIAIEIYHHPGNINTNIRLQDMTTYLKEEYEVLPEEVTDHIIKLRLMYPKSYVSEFIL